MMISFPVKYRRSASLLVGIIFLIIPGKALPQNEIEPVQHRHLERNFSIRAGSLRDEPGTDLIKNTIPRDKNEIFLDSLKKKASRNTLTRKIYDLVIVDADSSGINNVSGESEAEYKAFTGKIIRNIVIKRLDVFGVDIDNPDGRDQRWNFLNQTHISTSERIIRNNLLFSRGDTLSPISVSDNERVLRDLSFIDDARIRVIQVSREEVDIVVITKDVYSLGGSFSPFGFKRGRVSVFESNFMGMGHELGIEMPFSNNEPDSPGLGVHYNVDNLGKSFATLKVFYYNGLGEESYGVDISRRMVSSSTRYAGGISVRHVYRKEDLDTLPVPEPLRYNLQDYWLSRSFLLNSTSVTRLFLSVRYTNNNVYDRPFILPDSYYSLQKYRLYLGSVAISRQRFFKTALVYGYGRTEDIPYGGLIKVTLGKELNEFKTRNYAGSEISYSKAFQNAGYLYGSASLGAFINGSETEQGILALKVKYFSDLVPLGRNMIRNFVTVDYTRGFDRNMDERLLYYNDNGFSGFRNDSIRGEQRFTMNLETVLFSSVRVYGFRLAFFGFVDFSSLAGMNQILANGTILSGLGLGLRVRNDNLIFNTFQIRLGFFPDPPSYSRINHITVSGEHPLRFDNFEPGAPAMIPYR